jgi:hypothetical protein
MIPGMRVAVLSDIDADLQARERVLDAVDRARADEVWCLGDIVGSRRQRTGLQTSSRCASARRSRWPATRTAGLSALATSSRTAGGSSTP